MTRRVVLVDDEPDLVWSTVRRLEQARPAISWEGFTDPREALASIEKSPPDAIVTDVRMPGVDGLELILRARSVAPGLAAVVVTAFGTPEVRDEVRRRGSISYLEKPVSLEALLAAVDAAVAPRAGFSGSVSLISLPDVVQMHALARFTGALGLTNGQERATLYFAAGELLHAECGSARGLDAAYAALGWEGGSFDPKPGVAAPAQTIIDSWQQVLMEACRRLDETGRSADETNGIGREGGLFEEDAKMANVKETLEGLAQIDGFIGACLVDSNSGMMLGAQGGGSINLEVAAAGNTEVVRAKRKVMAQTKLNDHIEDILITLGKHFHLIRPVAAKDGLFIYLALDRAKANLAMGRHKLADAESALTL